MKVIDQLKQRAKQLKSETEVLIIAYSDKRTPLSAKILIGLTAGYLLSPIDLIPDFIPVLGLLDDLIIVPLLISFSIKLIPKTVLIEAREKVNDNPRKTGKQNWIVGGIIILIWLTILYFLFVWIRKIWN